MMSGVGDVIIFAVTGLILYYGGKKLKKIIQEHPEDSDKYLLWALTFMWCVWTFFLVLFLLQIYFAKTALGPSEPLLIPLG